MKVRANRKPKGRLCRQDWIDAARESFIESGAAAIKVDNLAGKLHATRGSFYWHFTDHADLTQALLQEWMTHTNIPFQRVLEHDGDQPLVQIIRYCEIWLADNGYDPQYDAAMRDWARTSEAVEKVVREIEDKRIEILVDIFSRLGFDEKEATVRGRTVYYHQVGYFTLKVVQTREERLSLFPTYFKVLTGCPLPPGRVLVSA